MLMNKKKLWLELAAMVKRINKEEVKIYKEKKIRFSMVNDTWIYKPHHMFTKLTKRCWNFDWKDESYPVTKYKLNQYYDWHCDSWDKPYDRKDVNHPEHGRIKSYLWLVRWIRIQRWWSNLILETMIHICEMNQNIEYNVKKYYQRIYYCISCFVWHGKPVTSGTRYSLVVWHLGRPFK